MSWKLKGRYVASCSCRNVCPCPTASAPPDNPDGSTNCYGVAVFDIREGDMDGVSLGGTRFALANHFPDVLTNGNWTIGITVDEGASDDQTKALEAILSGQQGGPFADMAPLIGTFAGVSRGAVSLSNGNASIGGMSFTYEPIRGPDGNPTTTKNAAFGFAPEFEIGTSQGQLEALGTAFVASYGESADFEYSSEGHETVRA